MPCGTHALCMNSTDWAIENPLGWFYFKLISICEQFILNLLMRIVCVLNAVMSFVLAGNNQIVFHSTVNLCFVEWNFKWNWIACNQSQCMSFRLCGDCSLFKFYSFDDVITTIDLVRFENKNENLFSLIPVNRITGICLSEATFINVTPTNSLRRKLFFFSLILFSQVLNHGMAFFQNRNGCNRVIDFIYKNIYLYGFA